MYIDLSKSLKEKSSFSNHRQKSLQSELPKVHVVNAPHTQAQLHPGVSITLWYNGELFSEGESSLDFGKNKL